MRWGRLQREKRRAPGSDLYIAIGLGGTGLGRKGCVTCVYTDKVSKRMRSHNSKPTTLANWLLTRERETKVAQVGLAAFKSTANHKQGVESDTF